MMKLSVIRLIALTGALVLYTGLFCYGLELLPLAVFRILALIGIVMQIIALIPALIKNRH